MKNHTCSYCGKDTSKIDFDYLSGTDHLSCVLEAEMKEKGEYDTCVICAKETPYKRNVHIHFRAGYIQGVGQLCTSCYNQSTDRSHITVPEWVVKNTPNDSELGEKVRRMYYEQKDNR